MTFLLFIGYLPSALKLLFDLPEDYEIWLLGHEKWLMKVKSAQCLKLYEKGSETKDVRIEGVSFSPYELSGETFDAILIGVPVYEISTTLETVCDLGLKADNLIMISNALGIENILSKRILDEYCVIRGFSKNIAIWRNQNGLENLYSENWKFGILKSKCRGEINILDIPNSVIVKNTEERNLLNWEYALTEATLYYLSAVLNCPINYLVENKDCRELVEALIDEGERVARAHGVSLRNMYSKILRFASSLKGIHSPIENLWSLGIKSEVEFFNGYIYRVGKERGVSAYTHRVILHLIRALEGIRGYI